MAGSRTLTANAQAKYPLTAETAFNAVKISWGGAVGDKWYSDCDRTVDGVVMDGRVTEWGQAISRLGGSGEWSVTLADTDGVLRGYVQSLGVEKHRVTLYQIWDGLVQADWPVVWAGVTEGRFAWAESDPVIRLGCVGAERELDGPLGTMLDRADFPYAAPDEYGQCVPVVYGKKRGVRAVWAVGGGPLTYLTAKLAVDGTTFYVQDPTQFPASSAEAPIKLWIGRELMEGYFDAGTMNLFHITDRNVTLWTGTVDFFYESFWKIRLTTGEVSGYWNGFALAMQIADSYPAGVPTYVGPTQYRTITQHINSGGEEYIYVKSAMSHGGVIGGSTWPWVANEYDFVRGFKAWQPPAAYKETAHTAYIRTHRQPHDRGEPVRYAGADGAAVYVASDRASTAVNAVYAQTGEQVQLLPSSLYTVNLDDSQFAAALGGNCTTVSFRMPPEYIRWTEIRERPTAWFNANVVGWTTTSTYRRGDNQIVVDLEGPGEGYPETVIEHPLRAARHIAVRAGLDAGRVDEAAMTIAVAAKPDYRCAFGYTRNVRALDAVQELAEQCECAFDWTEGNMRAIALTNDLNGATLAKTVGTERVADTYAAEMVGLQASTTQITARYTDGEGKDRDVSVWDDAAMADVGVIEETLDCWGYANEEPCKAAATWWLYRKRYQTETRTAAGFLNYLDLLPGDVVSIGGNRGWVATVTAHPGSRGTDHDRLTVNVAVPPARWYDEYYVFPSASHEDPPEPSATEQAQDAPIEYMPPAPNPDDPTTGTENVRMLRAEETQEVDDTDYDAQPFDADGDLGGVGHVKRANGTLALPYQTGFLGLDGNGEKIFIPVNKPHVMLSAKEAMAADDTEYDAYLLNADGVESGVIVTVRRVPGVDVADGDKGFLGVDDAHQAIFVPVGGGGGSETDSIEFVISGGGAVIGTGIAGYLEIPFACTITAARIVSSRSTTTVIDIWKDTYANFPPTDADSITAAAPPTLTAATKAQDTTLTDWTIAIAAGDWLVFNVDSNNNAKVITVSLTVTL